MHTFEMATTGRSTCRGCGQPIAKGVLRFGERRPNPYGDDGTEMTHWFHVPCGAFRRPEAWLQALQATTMEVPNRVALEHDASIGVAHARACRVSAAERASSGRATCRSCRSPILKDAWRISLVYDEDGRFVPAGFVHAGCAKAYCETGEIQARLRHFSPTLTDADIDAIVAEVLAGPDATPA